MQRVAAGRGRHAAFAAIAIAVTACDLLRGGLEDGIQISLGLPTARPGAFPWIASRRCLRSSLHDIRTPAYRRA
jgi:hypothetical protein